MNLKDRQKQLNKAKDFIKGGKKEKATPEKPKETKTAKKEKGPKKKKYVAYHLEKDLIQQIQIQAAKNGERPCHFVERTMEKELAGDQ